MCDFDHKTQGWGEGKEALLAHAKGEGSKAKEKRTYGQTWSPFEVNNSHYPEAENDKQTQEHVQVKQSTCGHHYPNPKEQAKNEGEERAEAQSEADDAYNHTIRTPSS